MADNNNDLSLNQDPLRPKGNRPAENARQATPASLLAQMNWQGSDAAQDFLGLNGDPAPSVPAQIAAPAAPQASAARAAARPGDSSWLMDANPQTQRELNARVEPPEPLDVEDGSEESQLREPAVLDASWSEPREPRGSSKRPLVAAIAGLAIVAAAGMAFMKFKQGSAQPSTDELTLAKAPGAEASKPAPRPPDVLEIPKSPNSAATGATPKGAPSTGRMPLDRTGRATPAATPEPSDAPPPAVAASSPQGTPPAKPRFVPARAASAPADSDPKPASKPELASSIVPAPQPSVAPAVEPAAPAPPPEGQLAQSPPSTPERRPAFQPLTAPGATQGRSDLAKADDASAPPAIERPEPVQQAPAPIAQATAADVAPAPSVPTALLPAPDSKPAAPATVAGASSGDSTASVLPQAPLAQNEIASAAPAAPPRAPAAADASRVRVISSTSGSAGDASNARPAPEEPHQAAATPPTGSTPTPAAEPAASASPADVNGSAAVQAPAVANREGTLDARDVLLPQPSGSGVRVAQAKDMISVWDGTEIPMEHIATRPKVLTPQVGEVRVKLKSKDVFEGRLYAVGENAVWLEGAYGRMSLDNARIATVEKVATEPAAAAKGGAGAKGGAPNLSDRVRVKTPGGLVFGKVISKEEGKVTLLTDAGPTLTVDAKAVEYLAPSPALIIKKEAPKK